MPYSSGTKTIKLVSEYLNQMVNAGPNDRLEWIAKDPTDLSYRIFNAMAASKKRVKDGGPLATEPYLSYARLKSKYIIRKTNNSVIAEPRDVLPLEAIRVSMSKIVLGGLIDPMEVIGACIKHKADTIDFPDAIDLSAEDLTAIYNWAEKNAYKVIVLPNPDGGIQLAKSGEGKVVWTPTNMGMAEPHLKKEIPDHQESTSQIYPDTTLHLLGLMENSSTSPKDTLPSETSTD
jgi:hypothetical protein